MINTLRVNDVTYGSLSHPTIMHVIRVTCIKVWMTVKLAGKICQHCVVSGWWMVSNHTTSIKSWPPLPLLQTICLVPCVCEAAVSSFLFLQCTMCISSCTGLQTSFFCLFLSVLSLAWTSFYVPQRVAGFEMYCSVCRSSRASDILWQCMECQNTKPFACSMATHTHTHTFSDLMPLSSHYLSAIPNHHS